MKVHFCGGCKVRERFFVTKKAATDGIGFKTTGPKVRWIRDFVIRNFNILQNVNSMNIHFESAFPLSFKEIFPFPYLFLSDIFKKCSLNSLSSNF
jgi:hypothetical protein